ncbi:hypothetical protein GKO49_09150 [Xanthomonas oryzae pv. oryzae]|nr:hypothetical protein GKO49_09150 [Xanthomonas oryzae pv. oryzae]
MARALLHRQLRCVNVSFKDWRGPQGTGACRHLFGLLRVVIWILDHRADALLRAHREQVFIIESYVSLVANAKREVRHA